MQSKPIEIVLSSAEKADVIKRTIKDKQKLLDEVERKIRELKREDAEMAYLTTFIGPEYINPGGKSNALALQPLEQERELLIYLISTMELKLQGGIPSSVQNSAGGSAAGGIASKWGS